VQTKSRVEFTKPTTVLFDLDNTLYPYAPCHDEALKVSINIAASRFNLNAQKISEAFDLARSIVKHRVGIVAARHSRILYFHCMLEQLGLGSQPEEALRLEQLYWRNYLVRMKLFPDVLEFITNLSSFGIKLGLVTDLTAQIQFRKLAALGLSSAFDAVVTSEEAGGEKETGLPYRLSFEKLGLSADDTVWMIGDTEADIAPARKYLDAFTICITAGLKYPVPGADAVFGSFYELNRATNETLNCS
jgi:FMN phosphatase YigB (HAD superfamily)